MSTGFSYYENGLGLVPKVNFLEYLGRGVLGCCTLSKLPFGHFSNPTDIFLLFTLK